MKLSDVIRDDRQHEVKDIVERDREQYPFLTEKETPSLTVEQVLFYLYDSAGWSRTDIAAWLECKGK